MVTRKTYVSISVQKWNSPQARQVHGLALQYLADFSISLFQLSVAETDCNRSRAVTSAALDDVPLEPASSRHQEHSVAGDVQIQTQDSPVQLQSLTLTNITLTLTLMQCLQLVIMDARSA